MSDTTCNYNKTHGFFNRREIRMVAQGLGLPEERIEEKLNKLGFGEIIKTSELLNLIESGTFFTDFYLMYNNQSGRYNSVVFAKALQLIDAHLFNFNEILKARLAFDVYEMTALRHNKNNLDLILRTINFCDHRISALKLKQRLRHFNLSDSKVLNLCEYFDLLLICNRENTNSNSSITKKIDLADPKTIDQQVMDELNMKYLRDERNWFFEEKFPEQKAIGNSVWPAKVVHQNQIDEAARRKAQLQRQLSASISSLKQSRAGSACSTQSHLSSPSFRQSRPVSNSSFTSITPIINRSSTDSSEQLKRTVVPKTETKKNEVSNRLQQLEVNSSFLAIKYAIHQEDYMNELFPNGYFKPIIIDKPVERCRVKKSKPPVYWLRRAMTK